MAGRESVCQLNACMGGWGQQAWATRPCLYADPPYWLAHSRML